MEIFDSNISNMITAEEAREFAEKTNYETFETYIFDQIKKYAISGKTRYEYELLGTSIEFIEKLKSTLNNLGYNTNVSKSEWSSPRLIIKW